MSTISELFSADHTIASELFDEKTMPHELISKISKFIYKLGLLLDKELFYSPSDGIWIAKSAKIAPSVYINAPCIIDEYAEIRHCAFLRGSCLVGKYCVVGNSCELKNVILFDNVNVPHFNYVGDSILGYKSHFGAGAITSNVKMDRSEVSLSYGEHKIHSSMTKLGALVGDFVEVGCGAVLNPGTVIGRNTNIYPLSSVRGYVPANSIYKSDTTIERKLPYKTE